MKYPSFRLCLWLCLGALPVASPLVAQWFQFGGPGRDFVLSKSPQVASWDGVGPELIWRHELGPGYAGLVTDNAAERLFTLTREGEEEVVVGLDAATGKTLWQHRYRAPVAELRGVDMSYGNAPQATPLFSQGRLFSLGFTGVMSALDATTGDLLWSHDLGSEHNVRIPYFGHAASPLLVNDPQNPTWQAVVVLAGGALAFDPANGELLWQNRSFDASYASPILVQTAFGRQLIVGGAGEVVGLEPTSAKLLWRHEFANQHRTILGTPILVAEDLLFVSAYFLGSRGLKLAARDRVEVLWEQSDFQVSHFNAVRRGGTIFSTFRNNLLALDAHSGEILWRQRRFGAANLLQSEARTLVLGDQGQLTEARLDKRGLEQVQSAQILGQRSWTPPTVIGNRLYARDQQVVAAFDLSRRGAPAATAVRVDPEVPATFTQAIEALLDAALRSDAEAIESALERFSIWSEDPELGSWAAYHQGFGRWILSRTGPADDRLDNLDRAVEAQRTAVDLDPDNAEAHALLGTLYPAYYRLAPRRASVVGPLGDEHLGRALILEPDNPRALAIRGLDLAYSPPQWGGDPAAARLQLAEVISRSALGQPATSGPRSAWQVPMARAWLARLLLTQEPREADRARELLEETLAHYPEYALAQSLRSNLEEDDDTAAQETAQDSGSSTASSRPR